MSRNRQACWLVVRFLSLLFCYGGGAEVGFAQAATYSVGWDQGIEVVFTPDSTALLDGKLLSGTLSLRTRENTKIVTFGEISLSNLHHVAAFGERPTINFSPL
jgi:hypothetical protein